VTNIERLRFGPLANRRGIERWIAFPKEKGRMEHPALVVSNSIGCGGQIGTDDLRVMRTAV
jgi:hypothetical protein